jgi:predicted small lipoprotein YifL
MKILLASVFLAALINLAGCAPIPPHYTPPADLTAQTGATVLGSMTVNPSPLSSNTKIIVSDVDNQYTLHRDDDWKTPLLITPGHHTLDAFICKCSTFGGRTVTGLITLPSADFQADEHYTLRTTLATGATVFQRHFVTAWIEDEAGNSITPHYSYEVDGSDPRIVRLFEDPTYKGD